MFVKDLVVVTIPYVIKQRQGTWHAQDDFEFTGYGKEVRDEWVFVAPNREVAIAVFEASKGSDRGDGFRILEDEVKVTRVNYAIFAFNT